MNRVEEYESAILSKYEEAKKALDILNDSELKLAVYSKCITSTNLILLDGVGDDLLSPSDFNYLALKVNALSNKLLEYFKEDIEKKGALFFMTRKEEYHTAILSIYRSGRDFIKLSKYYCIESLNTLCNEYINLIDEIIYCAFVDDFILPDDYDELLEYADRISNYLKECME